LQKHEKETVPSARKEDLCSVWTIKCLRHLLLKELLRCFWKAERTFFLPASLLRKLFPEEPGAGVPEIGKRI